MVITQLQTGMHPIGQFKCSTFSPSSVGCEAILVTYPQPQRVEFKGLLKSHKKDRKNSSKYEPPIVQLRSKEYPSTWGIKNNPRFFFPQASASLYISHVSRRLDEVTLRPWCQHQPPRMNPYEPCVSEHDDPPPSVNHGFPSWTWNKLGVPLVDPLVSATPMDKTGEVKIPRDPLTPDDRLLP